MEIQSFNFLARTLHSETLFGEKHVSLTSLGFFNEISDSYYLNKLFCKIFWRSLRNYDEKSKCQKLVQHKFLTKFTFPNSVQMPCPAHHRPKAYLIIVKTIAFARLPSQDKSQTLLLLHFQQSSSSSTPVHRIPVRAPYLSGREHLTWSALHKCPGWGLVVGFSFPHFIWCWPTTQPGSGRANLPYP